MRKRIVLIAVLLLAGAIVNVAVAWGCALWFPLPDVFSPKPIECPATWPAYLEGLWPAPATARERVGIGQGIGRIGVSFIDVTSRDAQASVENPITDAYLYFHRFGIPARSMQWEDRGLNAGERSIELLTAAWNAAGWRNGIRIPGRLHASQGLTNRRLPLTTIWPGFAINTIFYAAILWLLFFAPRSVRRSFRRRRGLCPACAYPVGTSPVCTECGKPVTPRGDAGSDERTRFDPAR